MSASSAPTPAPVPAPVSTPGAAKRAAGWHRFAQPGRFLRPDTVAEVVAAAVRTPPDGHLHEVVLRPR